MKIILRSLIVSICCMTFMACGLLHVDSAPVDKPALNLPVPDPISLNDIHFIVITKENALSVLDELDKAGLKAVIIGLSGNDYKILAINLNKIKDFMILQNEIIKKYKEYYENKDSNKQNKED